MTDTDGKIGSVASFSVKKGHLEAAPFGTSPQTIYGRGEVRSLKLAD